MLDWMMILVVTAFAGSYWGFMFGTFMKNEVAAVQLNLLFLILFSFGGGFYANTGDGQNIFVKIISYISPMRYTSEMLMSRILDGKMGKDQVLTAFGYTWGDANCVILLLSFTFACFMIGWITIVAKSSHKFTFFN